jgi:hypothetical protein
MEDFSLDFYIVSSISAFRDLKTAGLCSERLVEDVDKPLESLHLSDFFKFVLVTQGINTYELNLRQSGRKNEKNP